MSNPEIKSIQIGAEMWGYEVRDGRTYIYSEGFDSSLGCLPPTIMLRWEATDREITAAAYGYGTGHHAGRKEGVLEHKNEMRKSLGLPPATE